MSQGGGIDIHVDIKSNDSAPNIFNARVLSDGQSCQQNISTHSNIVDDPVETPHFVWFCSRVFSISWMEK